MDGQPGERWEMPAADTHLKNTNVLLALPARCIPHAVTQPRVPTGSSLADADNRASAHSTAHFTGAHEQSRSIVCVLLHGDTPTMH